MKKSILGLLLVVVMCAGLLLGCSNGKSKTESTDSDGGDSSKDINVTLILSARDEFNSIMSREAEATAKETGVNFTVQDATNDAAKQIQFVETARNNGDPVVIVYLVDPSTAGEIVEKAGDMKVVFVNRYPTDDSVIKDNDNVVYVGSNESQGGEQQGEALANFFNEKGQKEIKYVLIQGILGNDSVIKRTEACLAKLEAEGIKATEATAPIACDWDRAKAIDKFSPIVSANTEFDCVISNNDAMAIGAVEVLKNNNIDPKEVPVVGLDGTPDGVKAVQNEELLMTTLQDAKGQGKGIIMATINLVEGNPINDGTDYELDESGKVVWIAFEAIYKDNAEDFVDYYN
ncbi:inositol transport system substrate-binding protein [Aequitasia blattaphilus]|uniref:Substrate-binding domain-containing protein n=1 Tax=Aequitasia blattaphilus TaxID=2949332 RepID=A0ABT1E6W0_9FIRM|nr:substrate-binding domain-containing protein [Aequitasia blattaphilus]MCP1101566.1 substrate-binding domain-containing protein [Aequitasia blattaphilus]MCR8614206.1 substrate-binding domain-containing protein [Aequitasia blattaphilus]